MTTAALLLAHFDAIADSPGGVARLRRLVLQLAVQGRLVEQDPGDEPASALLERIRAEKVGLVKAGKLRKAELEIVTDVQTLPVDLPFGWSAVCLREIGAFCGGMTPATNRAEYWGEGVPWVSPKDMKSDRIQSSELNITFLALQETRLRLLPVGSVLVVARSGILKRMLPVAVNDIECGV